MNTHISEPIFRSIKKLFFIVVVVVVVLFFFLLSFNSVIDTQIEKYIDDSKCL